jgi:hypothetical protein
MMPNLTGIFVAPLMRGDIEQVAAHAAFGAVEAAQLEQLEALTKSNGSAFTVRFEDGPPVFCGGVIEVADHHASAWSIMAAIKGRHLHAVTWRARQYLHGLPHRRVDCMVRSTFAAGHRWASRLGFVSEARLEDYYENAEAAIIYRLVRN